MHKERLKSERLNCLNAERKSSNNFDSFHNGEHGKERKEGEGEKENERYMDKDREREGGTVSKTSLYYKGKSIGEETQLTCYPSLDPCSVMFSC